MDKISTGNFVIIFEALYFFEDYFCYTGEEVSSDSGALPEKNIILWRAETSEFVQNDWSGVFSLLLSGDGGGVSTLLSSRKLNNCLLDERNSTRK